MNCTKRIFVTTTLLIFLLTGWLPWEKPASAMPRIQKSILPNRLTLLVGEDHSLPFVTVHLVLNAGSWRTPEVKKASPI